MCRSQYNAPDDLCGYAKPLESNIKQYQRILNLEGRNHRSPLR